jgi:hypothetical protein
MHSKSFSSSSVKQEVKEECLLWHPVKEKKIQENTMSKIFSEHFIMEITMFCKILVAMLFSVFTIFSYANFNACDLTHKDVSLAMKKIIQEQPDSIRSFDGERMYLLPHRIFPTNNGLF